METEVVVIGAGMAGLAAAEALQEAGVHFVVLEGDSRVGGRCKTDSFAGLTIEKGANWIHGPWISDAPLEYNPLWQMKHDFGLKGSMTDYADYKMLDRKGQTVDPNMSHFWEHRTEEAMHKCEDAAEAQWEKAEEQELEVEEELDYSVRSCLDDQDYLDPAKSKLEKGVAGAFTWIHVAFEGTQRARKQSNMWHWPENGEYVNQDFFVTDPQGFCTQFFQKLVDSFPTNTVHLNQEVKAVTYSNTNVEVVTKGGFVVKAKYAISTLPLGVMQSGSVAFDPPFSAAKTDGIMGMTMGQYSKVYLKFPENFWGNEEIIMVAGEPTGWLTWALNLDHPKVFPGSKALNFHFTGDLAEELDLSSPQEAQDKIMASLRKLFPGCPDPTDFYVSGWAADPLSNGAYSNWPLGYTWVQWNEMVKNEGNLFFAGEHTSEEFWGFLHGSLWSGQDAADDVIDALHAGSIEVNLTSHLPISTLRAHRSAHRRHFRFRGDHASSAKKSAPFLSKRPVRRHQ